MDDEASDRVPGDHYRRQAAQARRLADEATYARDQTAFA
jgi:hypothetical protein